MGCVSSKSTNQIDEPLVCELHKQLCHVAKDTYTFAHAQPLQVSAIEPDLSVAVLMSQSTKRNAVRVKQVDFVNPLPRLKSASNVAAPMGSPPFQVSTTIVLSPPIGLSLSDHDEQQTPLEQHMDANKGRMMTPLEEWYETVVDGSLAMPPHVFDDALKFISANVDVDEIGTCTFSETFIDGVTTGTNIDNGVETDSVETHSVQRTIVENNTNDDNNNNSSNPEVKAWLADVISAMDCLPADVLEDSYAFASLALALELE